MTSTTTTTMYDPRFRVPDNMQIVGPSVSGKTAWLFRLVRDAPAHFQREDGSPCYFRKIVYCYGSSWQPIFDRFRDLGMHFQPGLPEDVAGLFPSSQARPGLLILDDLMQESAKSPQIIQLFTRGTHHLELFTITLPQNLYAGGQEQASQKRNYHYTVLFKNPADTRYVKALGNRWLGDIRAFWQVYQRATHRPLCLSGDRPSSPDRRDHPLPHPHPGETLSICSHTEKERLNDDPCVHKLVFRQPQH